MTASTPSTTAPIDISVLPAPAQRILGATAPLPLRTMGARGIAPGLKPDVIVTVVCAFARGSDAELARLARTTLEGLPHPVLQGALSAELQAGVLELLAETHYSDASVVSRIISASAVTSTALEQIAEHATEHIGELLAASDSVLLRFPRVIEKLYMNGRVRMSTADRLIDLCVRNGLTLDIPAFKQAAAAIQNQLIPEPTEERTYDDELFQKAEEIAKELSAVEADDEDTHEVNDEGEEELKSKYQPLNTQISQMTISQKIRRATLGNSAERLLLVRDTNRLVATAAVSSPLLKEGEAARIAASRNVIDDVLRIIAQNRDFTASYQVKLNLVGNPRTPFSFSSRFIPLLRDNDLRNMSKSKNVPSAIQKAARQQLQRKKP